MRILFTVNVESKSETGTLLRHVKERIINCHEDDLELLLPQLELCSEQNDYLDDGGGDQSREEDNINLRCPKWIEVLNKLDRVLSQCLYKTQLVLFPPLEESALQEEHIKSAKAMLGHEYSATLARRILSILQWTERLLSRAINKEIYNSFELLIQCLWSYDDPIAYAALSALTALALPPASHRSVYLYENITALHNSVELCNPFLDIITSSLSPHRLSAEDITTGAFSAEDPRFRIVNVQACEDGLGALDVINEREGENSRKGKLSGKVLVDVLSPRFVNSCAAMRNDDMTISDDVGGLKTLEAMYSAHSHVLHSHRGKFILLWRLRLVRMQHAGRWGQYRALTALFKAVAIVYCCGLRSKQRLIRFFKDKPTVLMNDLLFAISGKLERTVDDDRCGGYRIQSSGYFSSFLCGDMELSSDEDDVVFALKILAASCVSAICSKQVLHEPSLSYNQERLRERNTRSKAKPVTCILAPFKPLQHFLGVSVSVNSSSSALINRHGSGGLLLSLLREEITFMLSTVQRCDVASTNTRATGDERDDTVNGILDTAVLSRRLMWTESVLEMIAACGSLAGAASAVGDTVFALWMRLLFASILAHQPLIEDVQKGGASSSSKLIPWFRCLRWLGVESFLTQIVEQLVSKTTLMSSVAAYQSIGAALLRLRQEVMLLQWQLSQLPEGLSSSHVMYLQSLCLSYWSLLSVCLQDQTLQVSSESTALAGVIESLLLQVIRPGASCVDVVTGIPFAHTLALMLQCFGNSCSPILSACLLTVRDLIFDDPTSLTMVRSFLVPSMGLEPGSGRPIEGVIPLLWRYCVNSHALHDRETITTIIDLVDTIAYSTEGMNLLVVIKPFRTIFFVLHQPRYIVSEGRMLETSSVIDIAEKIGEILIDYADLIPACIEALVNEMKTITAMAQANIDKIRGYTVENGDPVFTCEEDVFSRNFDCRIDALATDIEPQTEKSGQSQSTHQTGDACIPHLASALMSCLQTILESGDNVTEQFVNSDGLNYLCELISLSLGSPANMFTSLATRSVYDSNNTVGGLVPLCTQFCSIVSLICRGNTKASDLAIEFLKKELIREVRPDEIFSSSLRNLVSYSMCHHDDPNLAHLSFMTYATEMRLVLSVSLKITAFLVAIETRVSDPCGEASEEQLSFLDKDLAYVMSMLLVFAHDPSLWEKMSELSSQLFDRSCASNSAEATTTSAAINDGAKVTEEFPGMGYVLKLLVTHGEVELSPSLADALNPSLIVPRNPRASAAKDWLALQHFELGSLVNCDERIEVGRGLLDDPVDRSGVYFKIRIDHPKDGTLNDNNSSSDDRHLEATYPEYAWVTSYNKDGDAQFEIVGVVKRNTQFPESYIHHTSNSSTTEILDASIYHGNWSVSVSKAIYLAIKTFMRSVEQLQSGILLLLKRSRKAVAVKWLQWTQSRPDFSCRPLMITLKACLLAYLENPQQAKLAHIVAISDIAVFFEQQLWPDKELSLFALCILMCPDPSSIIIDGDINAFSFLIDSLRLLVTVAATPMRSSADSSVQMFAMDHLHWCLHVLGGLLVTIGKLKVPTFVEALEALGSRFKEISYSSIMFTLIEKSVTTLLEITRDFHPECWTPADAILLLDFFRVTAEGLDKILADTAWEFAGEERGRIFDFRVNLRRHVISVGLGVLEAGMVAEPNEHEDGTAACNIATFASNNPFKGVYLRLQTGRTRVLEDPVESVTANSDRQKSGLRLARDHNCEVGIMRVISEHILPTLEYDRNQVWQDHFLGIGAGTTLDQLQSTDFETLQTLYTSRERLYFTDKEYRERGGRMVFFAVLVGRVCSHLRQLQSLLVAAQLVDIFLASHLHARLERLLYSLLCIISGRGKKTKPGRFDVYPTAYTSLVEEAMIMILLAHEDFNGFFPQLISIMDATIGCLNEYNENVKKSFSGGEAGVGALEGENIMKPVTFSLRWLTSSTLLIDICTTSFLAMRHGVDVAMDALYRYIPAAAYYTEQQQQQQTDALPTGSALPTITMMPAPARTAAFRAYVEAESDILERYRSCGMRRFSACDDSASLAVDSSNIEYLHEHAIFKSLLKYQSLHTSRSAANANSCVYSTVMHLLSMLSRDESLGSCVTRKNRDHRVKSAATSTYVSRTGKSRSRSVGRDCWFLECGSTDREELIQATLQLLPRLLRHSSSFANEFLQGDGIALVLHVSANASLTGSVALLSSIFQALYLHKNPSVASFRLAAEVRRVIREIVCDVNTYVNSDRFPIESINIMTKSINSMAAHSSADHSNGKMAFIDSYFGQRKAPVIFSLSRLHQWDPIGLMRVMLNEVTDFDGERNVICGHNSGSVTSENVDAKAASIEESSVAIDVSSAASIPNERASNSPVMAPGFPDLSVLELLLTRLVHGLEAVLRRSLDPIFKSGGGEMVASSATLEKEAADVEARQHIPFLLALVANLLHACTDHEGLINLHFLALLRDFKVLVPAVIARGIVPTSEDYPTAASEKSSGVQEVSLPQAILIVLLSPSRLLSDSAAPLMKSEALSKASFFLLSSILVAEKQLQELERQQTSDGRSSDKENPYKSTSKDKNKFDGSANQAKMYCTSTMYDTIRTLNRLDQYLLLSGSSIDVSIRLESILFAADLVTAFLKPDEVLSSEFTDDFFRCHETHAIAHVFLRLGVHHVLRSFVDFASSVICGDAGMDSSTDNAALRGEGIVSTGSIASSSSLRSLAQQCLAKLGVALGLLLHYHVEDEKSYHSITSEKPCLLCAFFNASANKQCSFCSFPVLSRGVGDSSTASEEDEKTSTKQNKYDVKEVSNVLSELRRRMRVRGKALSVAIIEGSLSSPLSFLGQAQCTRLQALLRVHSPELVDRFFPETATKSVTDDDSESFPTGSAAFADKDTAVSEIGNFLRSALAFFKKNTLKQRLNTVTGKNTPRAPDTFSSDSLDRKNTAEDFRLDLENRKREMMSSGPSNSFFSTPREDVRSDLENRRREMMMSDAAMSPESEVRREVKRARREDGNEVKRDGNVIIKSGEIYSENEEDVYEGEDSDGQEKSEDEEVWRDCESGDDDGEDEDDDSDLEFFEEMEAINSEQMKLSCSDDDAGQNDSRRNFRSIPESDDEWVDEDDDDDMEEGEDDEYELDDDDEYDDEDDLHDPRADYRNRIREQALTNNRGGSGRITHAPHRYGSHYTLPGGGHSAGAGSRAPYYHSHHRRGGLGGFPWPTPSAADTSNNLSSYHRNGENGHGHWSGRGMGWGGGRSRPQDHDSDVCSVDDEDEDLNSEGDRDNEDESQLESANSDIENDTDYNSDADEEEVDDTGPAFLEDVENLPIPGSKRGHYAVLCNIDNASSRSINQVGAVPYDCLKHPGYGYAKPTPKPNSNTTTKYYTDDLRVFSCLHRHPALCMGSDVTQDSIAFAIDSDIGGTSIAPPALWASSGLALLSHRCPVPFAEELLFLSLSRAYQSVLEKKEEAGKNEDIDQVGTSFAERLQEQVLVSTAVACAAAAAAVVGQSGDVLVVIKAFCAAMDACAVALPQVLNNPGYLSVDVVKQLTVAAIEAVKNFALTSLLPAAEASRGFDEVSSTIIGLAMVIDYFGGANIPEGGVVAATTVIINAFTSRATDNIPEAVADMFQMFGGECKMMQASLPSEDGKDASDAVAAISDATSSVMLSTSTAENLLLSSTNSGNTTTRPSERTARIEQNIEMENDARNENVSSSSTCCEGVVLISPRHVTITTSHSPAPSIIKTKSCSQVSISGHSVGLTFRQHMMSRVLLVLVHMKNDDYDGGILTNKVTRALTLQRLFGLIECLDTHRRHSFSEHSEEDAASLVEVEKADECFRTSNAIMAVITHDRDLLVSALDIDEKGLSDSEARFIDEYFGPRSIGGGGNGDNVGVSMERLAAIPIDVFYFLLLSVHRLTSDIHWPVQAWVAGSAFREQRSRLFTSIITMFRHPHARDPAVLRNIASSLIGVFASHIGECGLAADPREVLEMSSSSLAMLVDAATGEHWMDAIFQRKIRKLLCYFSHSFDMWCVIVTKLREKIERDLLDVEDDIFKISQSLRSPLAADFEVESRRADSLSAAFSLQTLSLSDFYAEDCNSSCKISQKRAAHSDTDIADDERISGVSSSKEPTQQKLRALNKVAISTPSMLRLVHNLRLLTKCCSCIRAAKDLTALPLPMIKVNVRDFSGDRVHETVITCRCLSALSTGEDLLKFIAQECPCTAAAKQTPTLLALILYPHENSSIFSEVHPKAKLGRYILERGLEKGQKQFSVFSAVRVPKDKSSPAFMEAPDSIKTKKYRFANEESSESTSTSTSEMDAAIHSTSVLDKVDYSDIYDFVSKSLATARRSPVWASLSLCLRELNKMISNPNAAVEKEESMNAMSMNMSMTSSESSRESVIMSPSQSKSCVSFDVEPSVIIARLFPLIESYCTILGLSVTPDISAPNAREKLPGEIQEDTGSSIPRDSEVYDHEENESEPLDVSKRAKTSFPSATASATASVGSNTAPATTLQSIQGLLFSRAAMQGTATTSRQIGPAFSSPTRSRHPKKRGMDTMKKGMSSRPELIGETLAEFCAENRTSINALLLRNIRLLETSWLAMQLLPECCRHIDFSIKRKLLKLKIKRLRRSGDDRHDQEFGYDSLEIDRFCAQQLSWWCREYFDEGKAEAVEARNVTRPASTDVSGTGGDQSADPDANDESENDESDNNESDDDEGEDFIMVDINDRQNVLETSFEAFRHVSKMRLRNSRIEVSFEDEDGVDAGGLTREWLGLLTREIFKPSYALFTQSSDGVTFQPNPQSAANPEHLKYFKFFGRIVGKAIIEGFLLDVHFTKPFYKHLLGVPITYHDLEAVDPKYFKSLGILLNNSLESLGMENCLSFSTDEMKFGRVEVVDIIEGGSDIVVTDENKELYVECMAHHRMTASFQKQLDAFLIGLWQCVPRDAIFLFDPKELELLISGLPEIDIDDLCANTNYTGYNVQDRCIQFFWKVLRSFSKEEKALFLQFVTGSSQVPLEGFGALQGSEGIQKFNVHKSYVDASKLPTAHTCFNQLDLPVYDTEEMLRAKLLLAIRECSEGFGFA